MSPSGRMSKGRSARRPTISRTLARLRLATTSGRLDPEETLVSFLEGASLQGHQAPNADAGDREHLIEALARERRALSRALDLDECTGTRHDDVHVDLGRRVFRVVQVEHRLAVDDPDADGRHTVTNG